jgi:hypothetical protein
MTKAQNTVSQKLPHKNFDTTLIKVFMKNVLRNFSNENSHNIFVLLNGDLNAFSIYFEVVILYRLLHVLIASEIA